MRKVIHALAALVFVLICCFIFITPANAATIYTNSFDNTNLSDFTTNGSCNDSQGYLTAASGTCDLNWNTVINYGCVSADIYNATGNVNVNPLSIGTNFVGANNTNFVGGLNFGGGPNIVYLFDNEIGGTIHPYPSGIFELLSGWHHFDLCNDSLNYNLYYDSSLRISYTPSTHVIWNGLNFQVGSENELKNLVISDGYVTTSNLDVPLLKQTDINWGLQLYDSADKWSPLHSTIAEWGCALTSATMVLQYHNITKLPDGTPLDPGTLNTWLKSQKDGYVTYKGDHGLVNWLAISRLTKQAKPQNPNFTFDALEYLRSEKDDSLLTQDLSNNQPDILEEPGHFIVGTGQTDSTFSINDPFYTRTDLSQGYNNTYLSLGRYIPSHTDLSYIMLVSDPSVHITLTDTNNVSTGSPFLQNPLTGDQDPGLISGDPINIFYAPQPHPGTYFLTLTGQPNQSYNVTAYLYDINGNSTDPIQLTGTFDNTGKNTNIITFDNQSINNDRITPVITFETLLHDIDHLKDTNQIQKGAADALGALAKSASKSAQKKNVIPAKAQLFAFQGLLEVFHNRGVNDEAYKILTFEVQSLLNSL